MNNVGFVISKEDLVSGPETRLDHSGLLVIQMVRNLPAVLETWVQSLDWEDPLDVGKATHCSILLAWRIPWTL